MYLGAPNKLDFRPMQNNGLYLDSYLGSGIANKKRKPSARYYFDKIETGKEARYAAPTPGEADKVRKRLYEFGAQHGRQYKTKRVGDALIVTRLY